MRSSCDQCYGRNLRILLEIFRVEHNPCAPIISLWQYYHIGIYQRSLVATWQPRRCPLLDQVRHLQSANEPYLLRGRGEETVDLDKQLTIQGDVAREIVRPWLCSRLQYHSCAGDELLPYAYQLPTVTCIQSGPGFHNSYVTIAKEGKTS